MSKQPHNLVSYWPFFPLSLVGSGLEETLMFLRTINKICYEKYKPLQCVDFVAPMSGRRTHHPSDVVVVVEVELETSWAPLLTDVSEVLT